MVLLCEQKARFFESLAIEGVRILEYLADALYRDMLGEDLLASLLEGGHIETIGKLKKVRMVKKLFSWYIILLTERSS